MNHWIYTDIEMSQTPSVVLGMTVESESRQRASTCRFIDRCGARMRVPPSLLHIAKTVPRIH